MSGLLPYASAYATMLNRQVSRMLVLAHDKHPEFAEDCLHDPWSLAKHWKGDLRIQAVTTVMHSTLMQQDATVVDDQHELLGLFSPALESGERHRIQVQYRKGRDNTARANFTLLHEIGHYLQQTDDELVTWLFSITDTGLAKKLEEEACNRFAAVALLPTDYVNEELHGGNVDARTVSSIFERGRENPDPRIVRVSRPAVARRMADFLQYPGYVTLAQDQGIRLRADRDGTVTFDGPFTEEERIMLDKYKQRSRSRKPDIVHLWTNDEGHSVFSSLAVSRSGRQMQYFIVTQFVQ